MATQLDAERERLRKAGYTEAEVSQILIARESKGQQADASGGASMTGSGYGAMTGVASNLAAAGSYVRNFLPSMAANVATIADSTASGVARSSAAVSVAFKIVVVAVVAYVVVLEISQLRSVTQRAAADATAAAAVAQAKSMTNAELHRSYCAQSESTKQKMDDFARKMDRNYVQEKCP